MTESPIPAGYPPGAPRTAAHGQWIDDARDGKRFFVPHGGAGGYSQDLLRNEAIKRSRATCVPITL